MSEALGDLPSSSADHLWVDYWELLCLRHIDGEFSRADLEDWIADSTTRPDDQRGSEERTYDLFQHLEYRASVFGEWYPFEVEHDGVLRRKEWDAKRRFYCFFLMAANLRYFKPHLPTLTDAFEVASSYCLRRMLPEMAAVHVFGAKDQGRYTGTLWSKINRLAEDLCEQVNAQEKDFPPTNTGDGGLDLVGWVPPGDTQPGRLVVFAQCGCGVDWEMKQYTSSREHWGSRITLRAAPANVLFIPQCFRVASGDWYNSDRIHHTVLMDRVRMILTMEEDDLPEAFDGAEHPVGGLVTNADPIY